MPQGASVLTQPDPIVFAPGGSLAERLFQAPLQGKLHCAEFNLPFAEIIGDCLVVRARHHGKHHTNVVSLASLGVRLS